MAAIDLDGSSNTTAWLVTSRLELMTDYLNGLGSDVFRGEMTLQSSVINAGRLEVDNLADKWTMAGELNLQSNSVGRATLVGDALVVTGSILVQGNGDLAADTVFEPASNVGVLSASRLLLNGRTTFAGGAFVGLGEISQQVDAEVTGQVTINTARYDWDGPTSGGHTFRVAPGGSFTVQADLTDAYDNLLIVDDRGHVKIDTPAPWELDNGVIRLGGEAALVDGADIVTHFGSRIEGNGTIHASVLGGGEIRPGMSAGKLVFGRDYLQDAAGGLRIELGGPLPSDYDRVVVRGLADLAGWLDVDLIDGFVPQPGDVFAVLKYGALGSTFSNVSGLVYGAGPGEFLQPIFGADHLALYAPLAGDANFDGLVSGADYTIWADHFGEIGEWALGDFSGDGMITGADYTVWADHFGQSVSLEAASLRVPEPGSIVLALAAAAATLAARSATLPQAVRRRREKCRAGARAPRCCLRRGETAW